MTMAHDSTAGPSGLDAQTIEAVRAALSSYVSTSLAPHAPPVPARDGDQLRAALQELAAEARAKSVGPESLLIALKSVWYSLPTVAAYRDHAEQVRLLQRVVTMCIKAYYD